MTLDGWLKCTFASLCVTMIALACIGGVLNFSPIVFWDMWNGTLDGLRRMDEGDLTVWWAQHNEHRILISRILFWIEYNLFDGSGGFLIAFNFGLAVLAAAFFAWAYRLLREGQASRTELILAGLGLAALLLLWTQNENLNWAFQSQFFLAQSLPLAALVLLARSQLATHNSGLWFAAATLVGLASIGTMANGLLVQPVLVCFAIVARVSWPRLAILSAVAGFSFWIYLADYVAPNGHGSLTHTLLSDPLGLAVYALRYLGSPFYWTTGGQKADALIATFAGAVLVAATAFMALRVLKSPSRQPVRLALVLYLGYIIATAILTGGGRLMFGLDQAFAARYTTPALMAWAALIVVYAPSVASVAGRDTDTSRAVVASVTAFAGLLTVYQTAALKSDSDPIFNKLVAGLAAELQIMDTPYLATVYPDAGAVLKFSEYGSEHNRAFFGLPRFKDVAERVGQKFGDMPVSVCSGNIDRAEPVAGDPEWVRIHGWQFDAQNRKAPKSLWLVDPAGNIVGYALAGRRRPDVAATIDPKAELSGYTGYVRTASVGQSLTAVSPTCSFTAHVARNILVAVVETEPLAGVTAKAELIINEGWSGKDYAKSELDGLSVYGSFLTSDADTGRLQVRLKPGDRLLYRSGPATERQKIRAVDDASVVSTLPVSPEWSLLEVSAGAAPAEGRVFEFADEGDGWGEWSAIALLAIE